jgi:hypothetical protein
LSNLQKTIALQRQSKTERIAKSTIVLSAAKKSGQMLSRDDDSKTPAADLSKVSTTALKMIAQILEPTYSEGIGSPDDSSEEERKRKRRRKRYGM